MTRDQLWKLKHRLEEVSVRAEYLYHEHDEDESNLTKAEVIAFKEFFNQQLLPSWIQLMQEASER